MDGAPKAAKTACSVSPNLIIFSNFGGSVGFRFDIGETSKVYIIPLKIRKN